MGKDKGERQAKRTARKANKVAEKAQKAEDLAKIDAADAAPPQPEKKVKKVKEKKAKKEDWRIDYKKKRAAGSDEINDPTKPSALKKAVTTPKPATPQPLEKDSPRPLTEGQAMSEEIAKASTPEENPIPQSTIAANDLKHDIAQEGTKFTDGKDIDKTGDALKNEIDNDENIIDSKIEEVNASVADESDPTSRVSESGGRPDGSLLKENADKGQGKYTLTPEDERKMALDHQAYMNKMKGALPGIAIEKLGIEQYFPPNKPLQANFTGRYIGSRTLTASGGALYPLGLGDARRRAIRDKVQAKAKQKAAFMDVMDIAPQYDEEYKSAYMDMVDKYAKLSGGDLNSLLSGDTDLSRQFIRESKIYESRGRMINEANSLANKVIEDSKDKTKYVSTAMLKYAYDIRDAQFHMTDYLNSEEGGEDKVMGAVNMLRSYQNFIPIADEKIEYLAANPKLLPVNPDTDLSDPEVAKRLADATSNKNGRDYNTITTANAEFWDIDDIKNIVEAQYDNNVFFDGYTEEDKKKTIDDGVLYYLSNLNEKVNLEQHYQATQNLGYHKEAMKQKRWEKEQETRKEEFKSRYTILNDQMKAKDYKADFAAAVEKAKQDNPLPPNATAAQKKARAEAITTAGNAVHARYKGTPGGGTLTNSRVIHTEGDVNISGKVNGFGVVCNDGVERSVVAAQRYYAKLNMLNAQQLTDLGYDKNEISLDLSELNYMNEKGDGVMPVNSGSSEASYVVRDGANFVSMSDYNGEITEDNLVQMVTTGGHTMIVSDTEKDKTTGNWKENTSRFMYTTTGQLDSEVYIRGIDQANAKITAGQGEYKQPGGVVNTSSSSGSNTP